MLKEPIWFETEERGTEMLGVPTPGGEFRLTVMVDYNSPVLGTQHASMYRAEEFKKEIAPCRTFVFLRELEHLAKAGLIKGGDLNNAIVLEDREGTTKEQLKDLAKSTRPRIPGGGDPPQRCAEHHGPQVLQRTGTSQTVGHRW